MVWGGFVRTTHQDAFQPVRLKDPGAHHLDHGISGRAQRIFPGDGHHGVSQILEQIVNAVVSVVAAGILFGVGTSINAAQGAKDYSYALGAAGGTIGTGAGALTAFLFFICLTASKGRERRQMVREDVSGRTESYRRIFYVLTITVLPIVISSGIYNCSNVVDNYLFGQGMYKLGYLEDSIAENTAVWTGHHFKTDDGLIFVGACGIAVRSIAPYVVSKKSDPAVLVVDECGKFVISLLSGHLGGANALALKTAEILGAEPVVTTATDLHDRFAVDVFAKNNHCAIFNMKAAKEVSAAILAGESVGFYSEFPWAGSLPRGLKVCTPEDSGKPEAGIAVTVHRACLPFTSTVQIVPKAVVLGLGCKKDKEAEIIRQEAEACLESESIYQEAVSQIASISLKKEEQGILALAADWNIPFCTFGEAELQNAKGTFEESEFVKKITGVNNVCERSAVLGAEQGRLIKNKTGRNGVTTALALRNWEVHFE